MTDMKDCPMCGELMRLVIKPRAEAIPGTRQVVKREAREWVCPECDYFEEIDEKA
jgi:C4-type Zn-finger protein